MNLYLTQAIRAYTELFQTGSIQSSVEGENLMLNLKANVTGDILICIGPKENIKLSYPEIIQFLQTDASLNAKKEEAFLTLEQKFKGLALIPKSLIWAINFVFYFTLIFLKSDQLIEFINRQSSFTELWFYPILIAISLVTILFRKRIGFIILKPLVIGLLHLARMIRRFQNRKVRLTPVFIRNLFKKHVTKSQATT